MRAAPRWARQPALAAVERPAPPPGPIDTGTAAALARAGLEARDGDPELLYLLALAELQLGDAAAATGHLEQARALARSVRRR